MNRKYVSLAIVALLLLSGAILTTGSTHAAPNAPYVVNWLPDTDDGTCDAANCSLREAINAANAHAGPDIINFNISACPILCMVHPTTAIPEITGAVILNGFSQPGARPNSDDEMDAVYKVGLYGANAPDGTNGLDISGGNSIITGLVIIKFPGAGIHLFNGGGNIIAGNYIGVGATGMLAAGNERGILIDGGSSNNTIGGTYSEAINVIGGNTGAGIETDTLGGSADGNVIAGNLIGMDRELEHPLGNGTGIVLRTKKNKVGLAGYPGFNLVSGNLGNGIELDGIGAKRNTLVFNVIGGYGPNPEGNGLNGLSIGGGASKNKIGTPQRGNDIMWNGAAGIAILDGSSKRNTLRRNSISWNGGLGIDLGGDGVTANDVGDGDAGPNQSQNFPVVKRARSDSNRIKFTLTSAPNTTYRIEFFRAMNCDASGFGAGDSMESVTVTTNAAGKAGAKVVIGADFEPGNFITATATDSKGNTSEFSKCTAVE